MKADYFRYQTGQILHKQLNDEGFSHIKDTLFQ